MDIILDENLPHYLKKVLSSHTVTTVSDEGWSGISNGDLIKRVDGVFDVLMTSDKNLRYQQNLSGRKVSIVEIYSNRLPLIKAIEDQISESVDSLQPGSYVIVEP